MQVSNNGIQAFGSSLLQALEATARPASPTDGQASGRHGFAKVVDTQAIESALEAGRQFPRGSFLDLKV